MRAQRLFPLLQSFGRSLKSQPSKIGQNSIHISAKSNGGSKISRGIWAAAAVGSGAAFWYQYQKHGDMITGLGVNRILTLDAATAPEKKAKGTPQPNTYSPTKMHALYLWIHLNPSADPKKCARTVANLQKLVDKVSPADLRDESDEIWAGVGFGEDFYKKIAPKNTALKYLYQHRKGEHGEMPATGGDVFIHAKSDNFGKLFELAQSVQATLPRNSVDKFSDVYAFVYRNGRDLSGFIDGTENPADEDTRFDVAVNKETGGSFCITQRWIHNLKMLDEAKDHVLEGFVGRSRADSTELRHKPATSHVARMTSGTAVGASKPFQIVRQSMPYGTLEGDAGLFFIAFAESPKNFDYMLDRMVAISEDKLGDEIMKFGKCVSGNFWYFPSAEELKAMA